MPLLSILLLACALVLPAAQSAFASGTQSSLPSGILLAEFQGPGSNARDNGGFRGPSSASVVKTVAQAAQAYDDTPCELVGNIVDRVSKKRYSFRDESGTIVVEISDKKFRGQDVTAETMVRLVGEVERRHHGEVEVEVDYLEIVR